MAPSTDIWKKLNLKHQKKMFVDDRYGAMRPFINDVDVVTVADVSGDIDFYPGFAIQVDEVDNHIRNIAKISETDPVVWIAYPKSRRRRTHANSIGIAVGTVWARLASSQFAR